MIELTPADVAVILRHSNTQSLSTLPTAQLNEDGQTEIVRWIEHVGKLDDQLTPYAWFSLAEEAAASHDPDEPITIEMLPTYTLSGESEILELSPENHFDWAIEDVPVEFIENAEDLLDAGVPVRFLILAEAAGDAFAKRLCELCDDLEAYETQLLVGAINVFFLKLCENAGIMVDEELLSLDMDEMDFPSVDEDELDEAIEDAAEEARSIILALDPELGASLPAGLELIDSEWIKGN